MMLQTIRGKRGCMSVLALCLLAACSPQADQATEHVATDDVHVVKLGFAAPLTGAQAHYGKEYFNGVTLAVTEANERAVKIKGQAVRFELIAQDDQADPKSATQVAQNLVDKGIKGMIGHFNSGTSIPASKIYYDAGLPTISMATSPLYTQQGFNTTFRSMTSDTQQGAILGRYVIDTLHVKKIVVIDDRTAYGQGLADEFIKAVESSGGLVAKRLFTNDKTTDFSAIMTETKNINPDFVFYAGADIQAAPLLKQLRRLGVRAQFASGEMSKTPTFIALAGDAGEGAMVSLAGIPLDELPKGKAYAERYTKAFNMPVETYSPYGYDAAHAMIHAMVSADSDDPAVYLPVLAKGVYQDGVTSSQWSYDSMGNLKDGGLTIYELKSGSWVPKQTIGSNP